jgi:medium-chain acyl-[acyl-carrier-protein] hydrolase
MTTRFREETFKVKTYECRPDGNIKTASLMQYLQEVAALHAEQLGFGINKLSKLNSYWVLSNLRIEINELPKWNDEVTVKTWPSGHTRVIATREFIGSNQEGRELFRASSQWMILDKHSNRPKSLSRLELDLPKTGLKVLSEELKRLEPREDYNEADRITVPYSSIDLNGHVNNTEYVRWSMDTLKKVFGFEGAVHSIYITYLSEIFEGDELELLLSQNDNNRFYILSRRPATQDNVHIMEIIC